LSFIVTRAPFRVSFAGGGTDLPSFYRYGYGAVLSTAINKYVYVIINRRNALFGQGIDDPLQYRIRLSYTSTENVQHPDELRHPIVREALKLLEIDEPLDIATMADVPAGTGLGSSGTFSVALLHALHTLKGKSPGPEQLAEEAAHIEVNILGRPVGKQDPYAAAFGGLNLICFLASGEVTVDPVAFSNKAQRQLFSSLMLLYTGMSRDAGSVLVEQEANAESLQDDLLTIRGHAHQLEGLMKAGFSLQQFGEVLHGTWMRKRKLANTITNDRIDHWYQRAMDAGALGGKICGAGGGGFLLLVVESERREEVRQALRELPVMDINYEPGGSRVVFQGG
jgi:D-glycero-alpha-D-manno-heptose-7-phosphate kinase